MMQINSKYHSPKSCSVCFANSKGHCLILDQATDTFEKNKDCPIREVKSNDMTCEECQHLIKIPNGGRWLWYCSLHQETLKLIVNPERDACEYIKFTPLNNGKYR